jgi:hypothetical protein
MAICQLSQMSALDNLDGAQWVGTISEKKINFKKCIFDIFTRAKKYSVGYYPKRTKVRAKEQILLSILVSWL